MEKIPEYAFPTPVDYYHKSYGMTLRDYFAAKAMATMLPNYDIPSLFEEILDEGDKSMPELIAIDAYVMADAMLKARK